MTAAVEGKVLGEANAAASDPDTLAEAMRSPDADKWRQAIDTR